MRQKDIEKELGGVVVRHTAGLNLKHCTSSTVFPGHGLLKGLYYVTPASITRAVLLRPDSCMRALMHTGLRV